MTRSLMFAIALLVLQPALGAEDLPTFQSGDIIFHTSSSKQSYAIMWASKSLYSHVGLVEVDGSNVYVIEAISKVSRTPIKKWINRGRLNKYAVFRDESLSSEKRKEIVTAAKKNLGKGYDIFFTSRNKEIYCSELVDLAYRQASLQVGKTQKVKELDFDNYLVRKLVEKRWRKHPACSTAKTFDECWKNILEDELVTPDSIAADPKLKRIWSNYL